MLLSTIARRSLDAILLTYLVIIAYALFCAIGAHLIERKYVREVPIMGTWTTHDVIRALRAGNPIDAAGMNATFAFEYPSLTTLRNYAIFHAVLACAALSSSIMSLRSVARAEHDATLLRKSRWSWRAAIIGDRPMIWKELHHHSVPRLPGVVGFSVRLLVALSFVPGFIPLFAIDPFRTAARDANQYVRNVGTCVALLALIGIAVRGSLVIGIEMRRNTFDALLASRLSDSEIMTAKWLGCLWWARWPALWLGVVYTVGVLCGGVSIVMLFPLIPALLSYAGTLAAVGIWCSIVCSSADKAVLVHFSPHSL